MVETAKAPTPEDADASKAAHTAFLKEFGWMVFISALDSLSKTLIIGE